MLLGIHLTLMIGPTLAIPAPPLIAEALTGVEVTQSDRGRSGFQLTFEVGRSGPLDLVDYKLLTNPLLRPFNRVVLVVRFNILPQVLIDGIITNMQLSPGEEPGSSTLTVTGEDLSVMMDLEEKAENDQYAAQSEFVLATRIIASYARYGLVPMVIPPLSIDVPTPTRRIPTQQGTDLQYLQQMAARYSYVFYIRPGPLPNQSIAYWGPPERLSFPQKALSVNMGPASNVESINFQYNALSPMMVVGNILDADLNVALPVITPPISTRVPLASQPALLVNQPNVRKTRFNQTPPTVESFMEGDSGLTRPQAEAAVGLNIAQAFVRAQAQVDAASDQVVTASGSLDALRYGDVLQARSIVGLRGAGYSYDGNYYAQSVSHSIRRGEYKQRFTLNREGVGSLTPLVRP